MRFGMLKNASDLMTLQEGRFEVRGTPTSYPCFASGTYLKDETGEDTGVIDLIFVYPADFKGAVVPVKGQTDKYPRTSDGFLAYPGMMVKVYGAIAILNAIYHNPDYGYCAEVKDENNSSQGWVKMSDCVATCVE